jgi:wobble nucleotide-excising tRNase
VLERISEIQGVGLLHQANGKPHSCKSATLIYADNGRGKSTLAAVMRSVATGNPLLIDGCKTIDGTLPAKICLQFGSGHQVTYQGGAWSEKRPELLVFDADFIGRNVHSGGAVNTDHRKNLLDFALGDPAVAARQSVDKATTDAKDASEKVAKLINQLSGHHLGMSVSHFQQLPQVSDIDAKVAELQKRVVAAGSIAAIQARPVPGAITEPTLDIDGFFELLGTSLQDIHAEAEKTVKLHVHKLGKAGAEGWLNQGRDYSDGVSCPFCNQNISNNDLVSAYQTHFNAAYADLKSKVAEYEQRILNGTSERVVADFAKSVGVAMAQSKAWAEQVPTQDVTFDIPTATASMKELREFTMCLISKKQAAPAEPLKSAQDKAETVRLWLQFLSHLQAANTTIKEGELLINKYKTQLSGDSLALLQQQILILMATKRRFDPLVVDLFKELSVAQKEAKAAEEVKKSARENLEALMVAILAKYQSAINALLKKFGATFTIKGMNANFRGNAPRTEYGLLLRGKDVVLEGGPPSFATALSDGDKRTLAFAFFVASTLADPKLAQRVVIIDDPMCSLDMTRRQHTRTVLKQIRASAQQIIVLAHDAYFLRDLRDAFLKDDKTCPISIFQMVGASNGYTDFAAIDIDKECESVYAQHHRMLNQFSNGLVGDGKAVAKAIRPMLEGYLHRRFPGLLPKDLLFGNVVILIRDATGKSPLCHAQNLVIELNEINEYAGQFHHDTNPDAESVVITPSELKIYVDRSLEVIYKGAA